MFTPASFRSQFPAFIDLPDFSITAYYDAACNFVNPTDYGWLSGSQREYALSLTTAHMASLDKACAGGAGGVLVGATEGSVSASFAPPPIKSALSYWLNQTPYGKQLLALLSVKAAGGLYSAGSRATGAIRKFSGLFAR